MIIIDLPYLTFTETKLHLFSAAFAAAAPFKTHHKRLQGATRRGNSGHWHLYLFCLFFLLPVSLLLELSRHERTTDRARMIFRTIFLSFHFGATTAQPQTTRRTGPGCPSESCIPRPRVFQWYFFVHCTFIVWYLWSFVGDVRSAAHYVALQQIHV